MTKLFCEVSVFWQTALSALSLITLVCLCCYFSLTFRRGYKAYKRVSVGILLLIYAALFVLLQLDSRISGVEPLPRFPLPYPPLFLATLLTLGYTLWASLGNTRSRMTINNTSIKEAFDNLPTGVCFFNEKGLPILCNHAMHRFSFAVTGKDVQFITDSEACFREDFCPMKGVRKDGKLFILPTGTVYHLEKRAVPYEDGSLYTQFIATDVTELYHTGLEIEQENLRLRRVQSDLRKLSANVAAATREEEILHTKMLVHDEMGRCLVEARKYLREDSRDSIPAEVVCSWRRAVAMLKYNNDTQEEDALSQVLKACRSLNVKFTKTGALPKGKTGAYLLICAIRECLTNAVRYGGATELYADFTETPSTVSVSIRNDGKQPTHKVTEGGGLSTLRRRIEREGGTMTVDSVPQFRLTVTLPKREEGIL